jgi:hypothetical protein
MKALFVSALASVCVLGQAFASPATTTVFRATDESAAQVLSPQSQEQLRKTLATAQTEGIGIQSLFVLTQPRFRGTRIDWCLTYGTNCGQPAATVACKVFGYRKSVGWAQEAAAPTYVLGSDDIACPGGGGCSGLAWVVCENP